MNVAPFDPLRAMRILQAHDVRFIVIGGFAGRLWGSPTLTNDLDICYARDRSNLENLAAALRELESRLRGVAEELPFILDADTLAAGDHFTLMTTAGGVDILGFPAGSGGFEGLARTAEEMDLGDVRVRVAALRDLIAMKRASGRPKDLIEVEVLSALQEETDA